tara:strand:- start:1978 stop:2514 length:537 start_codon:yes stop_codon:yes gene_type:complete
MNYSLLLKILKFKILFILIIISSSYSHDGLYRKLKKQVAKEIKRTFNVIDFSLNEVSSKISPNKVLKSSKLLKIYSKTNFLGYAVIGTAPSKTDTFEFLILFDQKLIVKKTKILIYRENYGGEIASKRWLSQFNSKSVFSHFVYRKNISAISGATISVKSMTASVNYIFSNLRALKEI